jgi:hypothetical protein
MGRAIQALVFVTALLTCASAQAEPTPAAPVPAGASERKRPVPYALANTAWSSLAIESGVALTTLATQWIVYPDTPTSCSWCAPGGFDRSARSLLVADDPKGVGYGSHLVSLGALPLLALGGLIVPARQDEQWARFGQDVWIVSNAVVFTTAFAGWAKHSIARQRPAYYFEVSERTEADSFPEQQFLSFYSLDTAWAFTFAASSTTLAALRRYTTTPWLLGTGLVLASAAGLMRISADMHWASDVMVGAAAGSAVGVALPLLVHGRQAPGFNAQLTPGGLLVSGVF